MPSYTCKLSKLKKQLWFLFDKANMWLVHFGPVRTILSYWYFSCQKSKHVTVATTHSDKQICSDNWQASMMLRLKYVFTSNSVSRICITCCPFFPLAPTGLRIHLHYFFCGLSMHSSASSMAKAYSLLCNIFIAGWCKFVTCLCMHLFGFYWHYCAMMHLAFIIPCGMPKNFILYSWPRLWQNLS